MTLNEKTTLELIDAIESEAPRIFSETGNTRALTITMAAGHVKDREKQRQQEAGAIAIVEESCVGPRLSIFGVSVRGWLGTVHATEAHELADKINDSARSTRPQSPTSQKEQG